MNAVFLEMPEKPPREILDAIYRAWDHYGKVEKSMGSPEAERIYREIYLLAKQRLPK